MFFDRNDNGTINHNGIHSGNNTSPRSHARGNTWEIQNSKRARALSKQLRCLVCQNQSIDDSDADLARDLRIEVRRQITAGRSDEIIIDQIRQKYGDYVLFNPPLDRGTVFLWLAPIGFVGLAVLIIVLARRKLHTTRFT